jgi:hypothetical protein
MTTLAEVYDMAADLLVERGWTAVGGLMDAGPLPIGAAISLAAGMTESDWASTDYYERFATRVRGPVLTFARHVGAPVLTRWATSPGRTQDEVIAALRGAAEEERRREAASREGETA